MNCTSKWQLYSTMMFSCRQTYQTSSGSNFSIVKILFNFIVNWTSGFLKAGQLKREIWYPHVGLWPNVIKHLKYCLLVAGLMLTQMQSAGTSDWWSSEAWHSIYSLIQLALLCSVTVLNDCLNNSAEEGKYSNRYQVPCLPTPPVQSGVVTELNVDQKNHFFISCRIIVKH